MYLIYVLYETLFSFVIYTIELVMANTYFEFEISIVKKEFNEFFTYSFFIIK